MSARVAIAGLGVLGPGLDGWPAARQALRGDAPFEVTPMRNPVPAIMPAAERRRASVAIRLALEVALQATQHARCSPADLACVFSSCDGDGDTIHAVCMALTEPEYPVSPTKFSNSVHNAPAGYWSIASGVRRPSTSLCGYAASFAVGLLDAVTQVATEGEPVLYVSSDTPLPPPLRALHETHNAFGAGFVLVPAQQPGDLGIIEVALAPRAGRPDAWPQAVPVDLRENPAARALPLLAAIAREAPAELRLAYGEATDLVVTYSP